MAVQKAQIVQTALELLDRDGLEGVTLRRLATELNMKAASIYWHIPSKEQLLDEMANAILEQHFSEFDFTDDQRDWAEWLDTLAHELRAAMLKRREGARVVAGAHPDIARMLIKLWDLTVRVLHNAGFDYGASAIVTITMINFTFGTVIEEQASPPYSNPPSRPEAMSVMGLFPAMATAMEAWGSEYSDRHFDAGVRIFISGVRHEWKRE